MRELSIDFETRSPVELKTEGLSNYVRNRHTDIWCMAYALSGEPVACIRPGPLPQPIVEHVRAGRPVTAFNVMFEYMVWNAVCRPRYGWPELKLEQCYDTMADCMAMALPPSLDMAAQALGTPQAKDMEGWKLMLKMSRPRESFPDLGTHTWYDSPTMVQRLMAYCEMDVAVEQAIRSRTVRISPRQRAVWLLNAHINRLGIPIDKALCEAAVATRESIQTNANSRIAEVTGGAVEAITQVKALNIWVHSRGVKMESLDKEAIKTALAQDDLPGDVREALQLRQASGLSSVAKYEAALRFASTDGRIRDMFGYHAAGTGRFGGRNVQVHNLPRQRLPAEVRETAIAGIKAGHFELAGEMFQGELREAFGTDVDLKMKLLSECLRGMFLSADLTFWIGDFSNIEGRVLVWQSDETWKLDAFREYDAGTGPDLYKLAYSKTYGVPVDEIHDENRQVGKVMELACGYQGGAGALTTMCGVYGVNMTEEMKQEVKRRWRTAHPKTVTLWRDMQRAFVAAVEHRGSLHYAGAPGRGTAFRTSGSFLWACLPSGRVLCYPYPRVDYETESAVKDRLAQYPEGPEDPQPIPSYMGYDSMTKRWVRTITYGGKLVENTTQAISADLLTDAMLRFDRLGHHIVMHVHDEIVLEGAYKEAHVPKLNAIMAKTEAWAAGLPVAVASFVSKRYQKKG